MPEPKFNPRIHHRHSIRLRGFDYSSVGAYFVTIVAHGRECLFGEVVDGDVKLNDVGKIADECWRAIPEHFPNVDLGVHIIMPNHAHGIIVIRPDESPIGVGATHWVAPTTTNTRPAGPKRGSLGAIIGSYKMAVTRQIQRQHNISQIWQRNYYEHVIRNDREMERIWHYIEANPSMWAGDDENPSRGR
ncbi:MAG: transposase [Anaerolineaceae bacterium]|nr:MAG: transposase [Anaerolineaceae bacterium]